MNRKHTLYFPLLLAAIVLLLSACKTTRQAENQPGRPIQQDTHFVENIIRQNPTLPSLSAKMKLTAEVNGKKLSVNGSLKMQNNRLIRLSITPLLGIEVARLEINCDSVLILDRINQQYICMPLKELTFLANGELNFYTLQALFGHRLFLPGTEEVTTEHGSDFNIDRQDNSWHLAPKRNNAILYRYTANAEGQLIQTQIEAFKRYTLKWNYAEITPVGKTAFPARMTVEATGTAKQLKGQMEFSKIESGKTSLTPTEIPQHYKKLNADHMFMFKLLMNL